MENLKERVAEIMEHLANAFGGHSQYSLEHIAAAITGQCNNAGLTPHVESLARYAAEFMYERFKTAGFDEVDMEEAEVVIRHHLRNGLYRFDIQPLES